MVMTKLMQNAQRVTGELDKSTSKMVSAAGGSETLADLARRLATDGPHKTMVTPKRIRVLFNGAIIADTLGTTGAVYIWEHDKYPQFYLPMEAFVKPAGYEVELVPGDRITTDDGHGKQIVIAGFLRLTARRAIASPSRSPHSGEAQANIPSVPDSYNKTNSSKTLTEMILFAADLPSGPSKILRNKVKIRFDAVSQWFEEDTPIYIHPRDPFKRIDILHCTSRALRVSIGGTKIADCPAGSAHLYETSLPTRYYIPLTSVDISRLRPSLTKTQCPYKGDAGYHSVVIDGVEYKDVVWYYTHPTLECTPIAGMLCFYHEHPNVKVELMGNKGLWEDVDNS